MSQQVFPIHYEVDVPYGNPVENHHNVGLTWCQADDYLSAVSTVQRNLETSFGKDTVLIVRETKVDVSGREVI